MAFSFPVTTQKGHFIQVLQNNFKVGAFSLRFYHLSRNILEVQSCRCEMRGAEIETITV